MADLKAKTKEEAEIQNLRDLLMDKVALLGEIPKEIEPPEYPELDWSIIEEQAKELGKVDILTIGENIEKPPFSATWVVREMEIYVPLKGLIDTKIEKERLTKEIKKLEKEIADLDKKLSNSKFLKKAPKDVVETTERKRNDFLLKVEKLKKNLHTIIEAPTDE